jgi:competence protein ComEA
VAVKMLANSFFRYGRELFVFLGLGLAAAGLVLIFKPQPSSEVEIITTENEKTVTEEILVDIEGAVISPGVYQLPSGSRINDLLIACKGFSQTADRDWVAKNLNKAALLIDGAKIYIPEVGQSGDVAGKQSGTSLININQADGSLLETLPGIGPSYAQKIIDYREKNGGFKSIEELMAVSGIGKSLFSQIEKLVTIY